jgi:hypothetical protein
MNGGERGDTGPTAASVTLQIFKASCGGNYCCCCISRGGKLGCLLLILTPVLDLA